MNVIRAIAIVLDLLSLGIIGPVVEARDEVVSRLDVSDGPRSGFSMPIQDENIRTERQRVDAGEWFTCVDFRGSAPIDFFVRH